MDAAETGRAMEIARKKAAKRRTAKVFFMGDIKFSAFSFQQRLGAALRAGGWNFV
jgi:hypothetical protein